MPDTIDIDRTGEVITEIAGRVVREESGKPRLEPLPGTVGRWNAVLGRHAGKGPLRIAISRVSERRSLAQNRLLWRVYEDMLDGFRELAVDVGEKCPFKTKDDVHDAMKHRFLGITVQRFRGEEIEMGPTTTVLTVEQFSHYLRSVVEWAAQRGVYVEMPGESA